MTDYDTFIQFSERIRTICKNKNFTLCLYKWRVFKKLLSQSIMHYNEQYYSLCNVSETFVVDNHSVL